MTPNFYNSLVLFIVAVSLLATLQKQCCSINQKSVENLRRVVIPECFYPGSRCFAFAVIPESCSRESVFAVVVLLRNNGSSNPAGRQFLGDDD